MIYLKSVIFGVVQGVTEFLPVSSSGHLAILHKFLSLPIDNELAFDVSLHFATLLAVLIYFKDDILFMIRSFFRSFTGKHDEFSRLSWFIILGTIPAAFSGWFFSDFIEEKFRGILTIAIMLILVGILFIWGEKFSKKIKDYKKLTLGKALFIGLAQALALIPGTSRSGITIITGLFVGLQRARAVRFSFLLSIPIIFGAFLKKIPHLGGLDIEGQEMILLILAGVSAFVSAFYTIKYFIKFTRDKGLEIFAYYRFILAFFLFILYFLYGNI